MSAWRTRFDVARTKKTQTNQDKHDRKCTASKTNNQYLTTSRQTPLCLPSAPASMLQEKKTKKQPKHTGSSLHEKQNNHVPPALTTSRQTLSCLPGAPALRNALRSSPSLLSLGRTPRLSCHSPLLPLPDKHAAAINVESPATSSLTHVATRGLWRSVLLMAQFTVRKRHGAPLRCVELFGSSAARAPSFLCCVCPLFVCPCVSNLHYCGAPRCLTCL